MKYIVLLFIIIEYSAFASDWQQVDNMENGSGRVVSIGCADSNNCFALVQFTFYTRLYKSTDQGFSWKSIYQSDPTNEGEPYLFNAWSGITTNPDYFYMIMQDAPVIKKSIDGGVSFKWIILDTLDAALNRLIRQSAMFNSNIGFAVSKDWYYITKDGWESFEKLQPLSTGSFYSPIFINDSIVVMTYSSSKDTLGILFKQYNINQNEWKTIFDFPKRIEEDLMAHIILSLNFINDTLGFGCGYQMTGQGQSSYDLIYRTTDGGNNWKMVLKVVQSPPFGLEDIAFFDKKNGVAVGQYGKIWTTKDGGDTWIINEKPEEMTDPLTMRVAWAGQNPIIGTFSTGGGIFRYEGDFFDFTPDDTTDVEESIKKLLGDIEIKVYNYKTRLYISLEDEHFRKYKLQICDIYGHIVLEKELNSGIGTLYMPVDITRLTNGAYLYMISTGGVVAKTGKVLVITNY
ncbi:hypothetical protein ACFLSQ_09975 [Bacteroidota bacterium]